MDIQNLQTYKGADDKTKLSILRSELRRNILTIQGFSSVLKTELYESGNDDENLMLLSHIDKMIEAVNNMDEIIEILTG